MTQIRITRIYKPSEPAVMVEGARMALQAAAAKLALIANKTSNGKTFVFDADKIVAALDPERIVRGDK